jgi:hypothetical protein
MNLNFLVRKRFLSAIGIAVSLAAFSSFPVKAATVFWDLAFFSEGTQVGSGEFSYDDSALVEKTFIGGGGLSNAIAINASDNWYRLESLSAKVGDLSWTLADSPLDTPSWSPPETEAFPSGDSGPRGVIYDRLGRPSAIPIWIFGNVRNVPNMTMFSPTGAATEADFTQFDPEGGSPLSGTWTATQRGGGGGSKTIPEDSTMLGALIAVGILACLKKAKLENR